MKKKATRVFACFLAVLIAFNSALVPRSKAVGAEVVGTAALATSTLAAYMTATGIPLTVVSGGAAATSAATGAMLSGYAAATGGTYTVVTTAIASGVTIGTGGTIIIGVAAAAVLAAIAAWVIGEYGLVSGAEPVETFTRDGWYVDGAAFELMSYKNWKVAQSFEPNREYTCSNGNVFCFRITNDGTAGLYLNGEKWFGFPYNADTIGYTLTTSDSLTSTAPQIYVNTFGGTVEERAKLHEQGIGYDYNFKVLFGDKLGDKVALSLEPDYQPLPELAPLEQIVLAPNLAPEIAPESVPDAIFEQIAGNEFESTYTIAPVTNPDPDPDPTLPPDSGGESGGDGGLNTGESIGWLKRIALACEALAQKVLDGIQSIFAPDPALMQDISDTFMEKFGFVSDVYRLGSDLLSIDASTEPPVVYIHLDDAEGAYDYGGTVKALDMSWYQRYKPDVDKVLSGFLWLGYMWVLYKRIPGIIKGASMESDERRKSL